jgi:3-phenylpropionate/cinnamic acid dioxygenase small subunit
VSDDALLRDLVERDRIGTTIDRLFRATDARDWSLVRECFAESVHFDMTSLAGGQPARLSPAEITAGWEAGLLPLDALHHQTGNLEVSRSGDEASATCGGTAWHYRRTRSGRNTRIFVGRYEFHLVRSGGRWRIDGFRYDSKFVDGNLELDREPSV